LTLDEIDKELMRLPASPVRDEDIGARAELMTKRIELVSAQRAAAEAPKPLSSTVPVNVPDDLGGILTSTGSYIFAEIVDGKRVIKMPWGDFHALVTARRNSSSRHPPDILATMNPELLLQLSNFRF
jgi:hypothetical protein